MNRTSISIYALGLAICNGCSTTPSLDNEAARRTVEKYLSSIQVQMCHYELKEWNGVTTSTETSATARATVVRPCQGGNKHCEGAAVFGFERVQGGGTWLLVSAKSEVTDQTCNYPDGYGMMNKENLSLKVEPVESSTPLDPSSETTSSLTTSEGMLNALREYNDQRCECVTKTLKEADLGWLIDTLQIRYSIVGPVLHQGDAPNRAAVLNDFMAWKERLPNMIGLAKFKALYDAPCIKQVQTRYAELRRANSTMVFKEGEGRLYMEARDNLVKQSACEWPEGLDFQNPW